MRRGGRAALAIGAILLIAGQLLPASRVSADDTWSIDSWIELSGTSPAAGCAIESAVELRRDGYAVEGIEVLLALYVGEELISADRIATDEDGIAYLAIDTTEAEGQSAWIDVTLNDEYWWGTASSPGSGDSCIDGYMLHNEQGAIPGFAVATEDTASEAFYDEDSGSEVDSAGGAFIPEVGFYVQQRNLSCEYAAAYIATAAWNNPVSEYAFDEVVGWSANPHWGYRGDINGWWGNTYDYGVYAEALSAGLSQFGYVGDVFYGGGDASGLISRIDNGIPTLVWLGLWGDQSYVDYTDDGTGYALTAGMHVVVAYGYDDGGVYVSDPAIGGSRYYDWGTFMYYWGVLDGMSLGVYPA